MMTKTKYTVDFVNKKNLTKMLGRESFYTCSHAGNSRSTSSQPIFSKWKKISHYDAIKARQNTIWSTESPVGLVD